MTIDESEATQQAPELPTVLGPSAKIWPPDQPPVLDYPSDPAWSAATDYGQDLRVPWWQNPWLRIVPAVIAASGAVATCAYLAGAQRTNVTPVASTVTSTVTAPPVTTVLNEEPKDLEFLKTLIAAEDKQGIYISDPGLAIKNGHDICSILAIPGNTRQTVLDQYQGQEAAITIHIDAAIAVLCPDEAGK